MDIKTLNKELSKAITENLDTLDIVSRKNIEAKNIIKSKFVEIMTFVNLATLTGTRVNEHFKEFTKNLTALSNCFQIIENYINQESNEVQENPEQEQEIVDWYRKRVNKQLDEVDSLLQNIANINPRINF